MNTRDETRTGLRTDALTTETKRRQVRRFYRAFAEQHPRVKQPAMTVRLVMLYIGGAAASLGALAMALGALAELAGQASDAGEGVGMLAICGLFVVAAFTLLRAGSRLAARHGTAMRHYRFARFAADNGMTYEPGPMKGSHVAPLAARGKLTLTRLMRPTSERSIEFANYELEIGAKRDRALQFGGVCALRLPAPLPHIVLRAQAGGRSLATTTPHRAQALSLEGDFDEHFTLYCPEGYEQDALYLFTPDVMAELIDRVHGFDVEIVDDWLFLESSRDVVTLDPGTWHNVVAATTAVTAAIDRWGRWRDSRDESGASPRRATLPAAGAHDQPARRHQAPSLAGEPRVAPGGRRLRMTAGSGAVLSTILVVTYVVVVAIANNAG
ncbi:hypothetical protein [Mycetocola zhujimingii]|uniref:DUF3137 domain-containing protein n=1 Tax=Mycetocola zhujimingii TaxID=2079792 RepID=A0A2U1TD76_9MICO|nr:hypothetical protein [Mycetocola zhujimingii]PWC06826.1 hypothetical protein DF223_09385 [Mycetocola zhujimingii]